MIEGDETEAKGGFEEEPSEVDRWRKGEKEVLMTN